MVQAFKAAGWVQVNFVANNVCYNNPLYGVDAQYSSGATITNNYISGSSTAYALGSDESVQNNITGAIDFVNYTSDETGNYQLVSPKCGHRCRDQYQRTDGRFSRTVRPQGSAWDISAYEYVASVPAAPTGLTATPQ